MLCPVNCSLTGKALSLLNQINQMYLKHAGRNTLVCLQFVARERINLFSTPEIAQIMAGFLSLPPTMNSRQVSYLVGMSSRHDVQEIQIPFRCVVSMKSIPHRKIVL